MIFLNPHSSLKSVAAVFIGALMLSACAEGTDVELNVPLLEAAGVNLMGKKKPDPELPERSGIVIPPTKNLPEPGPKSQVAAAGQAWPADPEQAKKAAEREALLKEEEYCREGNWSGKGNIDEFNKTVGQQQRCRAQYVKDIIERNKEAEQARAAAEAKAKWEAKPAVSR